MNLLTRARSAFYGWRILAASGFSGALCTGLAHYGFSVFFLPISQSLGLTRAATSLVFSLSRAEGSIEGPLAGYLIDKIGPRKILFIAAAMMGTGYILLSRVDSFIGFLLVYMGIVSLGFNAIMAVLMAAVNSWFVRQRGLAMGSLMACFGVGGALIAPTLSLAIANFGWRTAALLAGITILTTILPLSLVFRRSPESMGLLPDGDKVEKKETASKKPAQEEFEVGRAVRTTSFWVLTIAVCLRQAGHTGVIVHFVPMLVWKGTDQPGAALLLGALALMGIPMRVLLGWAGDRLPIIRVIAIGTTGGAIALLFLNYAQPGWQFWLFVALVALEEAVGPLSWVVVGNFFGRRRFATIRGIMTAFTAITAATAPVIAGVLYDSTKSYEVTIWILAAMLALSAVVYALLRQPSQPA